MAKNSKTRKSIVVEYNDKDYDKVCKTIDNFKLDNREYFDVIYDDEIESDEQYIFISYSRKDTKYVNAILDMLNEEYNDDLKSDDKEKDETLVSFRFWQDTKITEEGEKEFDQTLSEKIKNCRAFLLFASENSIDSEWCGKELFEAYRYKQEKDIYCLAMFEPSEEIRKAGNVETMIPKCLQKILVQKNHIPQVTKFNDVKASDDEDYIKEKIKNSKEWKKAIKDLINILPEVTRNGMEYLDEEKTKIKVCRDKRKNIRINSKVKCLLRNSFEKQDKLENIDLNKVTRIEDNAFEGCDKLQVLNLPENLEYIGEYAFKDCESIEKVYFNDNMNINTLREGTFDGCSNLTEISIPKFVCDLPANIFNGCEKLRKVEWPDNLRTIGESAFENCKVIEFSGDCFPETLRIIDDQALANCDSIISIELPDDLKKLGKSVFKDCDVLERVKIGQHVQMIGASPFRGCTKLKNIIVSDKNKYYRSSPIDNSGNTNISNVLFNKNRSTIITVPADAEFKDNHYCVPDSVTTIAEWAFAYCKNLRTIEITDSIDVIKENAFYKCINLESVVLPEGVDVIDDMAFRNCSKLREVTIPNSVSRIGYAVFAGCENLQRICCFSKDSVAYKTFIHCNDEKGNEVECVIIDDK